MEAVKADRRLLECAGEKQKRNRQVVLKACAKSGKAVLVYAGKCKYRFAGHNSTTPTKKKIKAGEKTRDFKRNVNRWHQREGNHGKKKGMKVKKLRRWHQREGGPPSGEKIRHESEREETEERRKCGWKGKRGMIPKKINIESLSAAGICN